MFRPDSSNAGFGHVDAEPLRDTRRHSDRGKRGSGDLVEFVLGVLPVGELLLDRRTIAALAAAFELGLPLCDLLLPELALGAILAVVHGRASRRFPHLVPEKVLGEGIGADGRWKSMVQGDG
jgi:hypothetical protein